MAISSVFTPPEIGALPVARIAAAGVMSRQIILAVEAEAPLLPKINLTFGDDAAGQSRRVILKSPYARHAMEWVEFGFDESLKAFISKYASLIQGPGLDGKPFAPVTGVTTAPGQEVYAKGLAVSKAPYGFLETLMAVVEDCRMAQFPWLKEVLPEDTYRQLSYLQIPRRQHRPQPPGCYIE